MKKILLFTLFAIFGVIANAQTTVTLNVNDATDIVGTFIEETAKEDGTVTAATHYQPLESLVIDDYAFGFTTTSANASQQPAYYYATSTNTNQQKTVRVYNGTSMTINAPLNTVMTKIEFTGSNIGSNANFEVNNGTWTTQNNAVWEGETNTLVVKANATWRFSELVITFTKNTTSSIIDINADDDGPIEYYTLSGVRVINPTNGTYIVRQGNKINKVFIK